jgi:AcrR family transcriptional regulator
MSTDVTRTSLLDAAERLFAEHGFDGTSIRLITDAAGANVASIHYHFGSKENVLRGVTGRVAGRIGELRTELLEALPESPAVEQVLEAFIRPDLMVIAERGPTVARFLGRTYSDQTPWIQQMAAEQYADVRHTFFPLLAAALPRLTPEQLAWRMNRVVAVIVHQYATWPEAGMSEPETERTLHDLVTFLASGLRA